MSEVATLDEEELAPTSSLRSQVLRLVLALTVLWAGNLILLNRGVDSATGLRLDLARFGYDPDLVQVVESELNSKASGLHGRVRFVFTDGSDRELEVHGKRTLFFFDWRIHSIASGRK